MRHGGRDQHRRAIHIHGGFPGQRKQISCKARKAHQLGIGRRFDFSFRPGQSGILVLHPVVKPLRLLQNFLSTHGKQAVFRAGHLLCRFVYPVAEPQGDRAQLLHLHRAGLQAGFPGKAFAVILGAPKSTHCRIHPHAECADAQKPPGPVYRSTMRHAPHRVCRQRQHCGPRQRTHGLGHTERHLVCPCAHRLLVGHGNMAEPPLHGRRVFSENAKQRQRCQPGQQPHQRRQQRRDLTFHTRSPAWPKRPAHAPDIPGWARTACADARRPWCGSPAHREIRALFQ